ncbi:MAG TPA: type II toxin-antitoxin system VapC family toxin [Pirellulales bacterium]|nr:type II toxin-antitoxin system VapC family toxin [Pirellulales bacterium]
MKYILDASVGLKWVLSESDTPVANRLRDEFKQHVHELLAPDTLPVEIAHALTRAERKGLIPKGQAAVLFADVVTPAPDLHPHLDLLARAIDISSDVRIGVYDCLYIALAEKEQCPVVTADQKMLKLFGAHVIALSSLP